jgi:hypothetical protein
VVDDASYGRLVTRDLDGALLRFVVCDLALDHQRPVRNEQRQRMRASIDLRIAFERPIDALECGSLAPFAD